MTIEIGLLITILGGFIGVLGYLSNRDKKIMTDSKWRGSVDTKLDIIIGMKEDIKDVDLKLQKHIEHSDEKLQDHEGRLIKLETKKE